MVVLAGGRTFKRWAPVRVTDNEDMGVHPQKGSMLSLRNGSGQMKVDLFI